MALVEDRLKELQLEEEKAKQASSNFTFYSQTFSTIVV